MSKYCIGRKAGQGGKEPLLDGLDPCRGHRNEFGDIQILCVFGFSGGLEHIVAFGPFICNVGVCVDEG